VRPRKRYGLYPNVEELRAHACVNEGTVAYYDGLAISGERRRDFRPAHRPIELSVMAAPFSQTSSRSYADEFYGQAIAMVNFLEALCVRPARHKAPSDPFQHCSNAALIDALRRGVPAERLFESALVDRAGDVSWQPLPI
jgi:hypothetical protein